MPAFEDRRDGAGERGAATDLGVGGAMPAREASQAAATAAIQRMVGALAVARTASDSEAQALAARSTSGALGAHLDRLSAEVQASRPAAGGAHAHKGRHKDQKEKPPGPAFGSAAFEHALDTATGTSARDSNRVKMLFDGKSSFAERKRLIEGARKTIDFQTFIFTDDDTGWQTAHLLADAAKRKVQVRLLYDGLGSNRSSKSIFDFLRAAGVEVREYGDPLGDPAQLNTRWHEKHLIVDGKVSIEGGMNIADEYAFGGSARLALRRPEHAQRAWRDTDMETRGAAVGDAEAAFLRSWGEVGPPVGKEESEKMLARSRGAAAAGPVGGVRVRFVEHRPQQDKDRNTESLYLVAIRSARHAITIENAYFLPPPAIRDALVEAAKRGVDVRVMTNSKATNDMGVVTDAAHYEYPELLAAGVHIYERQTSTLHAKTATFDGKFSIVGSMNLNGRSEGLDTEAVMAVEDAKTAAAMERRFDEGLGETKEITPSELGSEGIWTHLREWGLHLLSWTF